MFSITLDELKQKVDNQKKKIETTHIVVLLSVDGCDHCTAYKNLLIPLEDELLNRNIVFYYLEFGGIDDIPLFAPSGYPSLVCFSNGVKIWEGIGAVDSAEIVKQALLFYLFGEEIKQ